MPVIETAGWWHFLSAVLSRNVLLLLACYANIYILFPLYSRKGKYLLYGLSLAALLLAYTLCQNAFDVWLSRHGEPADFFYGTYYNFSIGVFYVAFTLALELSKQWYRQQLLLGKIQAEKLETELQYLKAQLNPHFLFNSINTIYFQIDKTNADARESLRKFSELLRYQLYECNGDKILVDKELDYLQNYVDLHKLRKNNTRITFNRNENVRNFYIAPLLLIPFVENAFKHLSTDTLNTVELNTAKQDNLFLFTIKNSKDDIDNSNPHGIGLRNVQRRLDLLYENKHKLTIKKERFYFFVELQLEIS